MDTASIFDTNAVQAIYVDLVGEGGPLGDALSGSGSIVDAGIPYFVDGRLILTDDGSPATVTISGATLAFPRVAGPRPKPIVDGRALAFPSSPEDAALEVGTADGSNDVRLEAVGATFTVFGDVDTAERGDWRGIHFQPGTTGDIDASVIDFAYGGVSTTTPSVRVHESLLRDNVYGVACGGWTSRGCTHGMGPDSIHVGDNRFAANLRDEYLDPGTVDLDSDGCPLAEDCDDFDATSYPGAAEVYYDAADNDCNLATWDLDRDGDGHPKASAVPGFWDDCNDDDASIHPGKREVWYDGIDSDCRGDDYDADGDGFRSSAYLVDGMTGTDCDDAKVGINPAVLVDLCDGVDADCDGHADERPPTWYSDGDGDGYGAGVGATQCDAPATLANPVARSGDCLNTSDVTYPGAAVVDSATPCMTDADLDGYAVRARRASA